MSHSTTSRRGRSRRRLPDQAHRIAAATVGEPQRGAQVDARAADGRAPGTPGPPRRCGEPQLRHRRGERERVRRRPVRRTRGGVAAPTSLPALGMSTSGESGSSGRVAIGGARTGLGRRLAAARTRNGAACGAGEVRSSGPAAGGAFGSPRASAGSDVRRRRPRRRPGRARHHASCGQRQRRVCAGAQVGQRGRRRDGDRAREALGPVRARPASRPRAADRGEPGDDTGEVDPGRVGQISHCRLPRSRGRTRVPHHGLRRA